MSFECRPNCAACCIAPSITSPMPGLPDGKPAGVPCPHLTPERRCGLFGRPERPAVCSSLKPDEAMCRNDAASALHWLTQLEQLTQPGAA
jgi:hypothetical protein